MHGQARIGQSLGQTSLALEIVSVALALGVVSSRGTSCTTATEERIRGSEPSQRGSTVPLLGLQRDVSDALAVPVLSGGTAAGVDRPLDELSAAAASYLATRTGRIGVAVVVPSRNAVYGWNADELFPLASVAKVAIMTTLLHHAQSEQLSLTEDEHALLERMITVSDNDAASALWSQIGGGAEVEAYLRSIDLFAMYLNADDAWGSSSASARDVARLLAKLAAGEILGEPFRQEALDLLSRVVPEQRWGVTAGLSEEWLGGGTIGIKNGWYPAENGWRVHSAAVILPTDVRRGYVIVILTDNQPSMDAGTEAIEQVAGLLHRDLQPLILGAYDSAPLINVDGRRTGR